MTQMQGHKHADPQNGLLATACIWMQNFDMAFSFCVFRPIEDRHEHPCHNMKNSGWSHPCLIHPRNNFATGIQILILRLQLQITFSKMLLILPTLAQGIMSIQAVN